MKEKVITLIIGILIGAVITTAGFVVYNQVTHNGRGQDIMRVGEPPEMRDMEEGADGQNSDERKNMKEGNPNKQNKNKSTTENENNIPSENVIDNN